MKLPPPLYECSVCGEAVTITPMGEGVEPEKKFYCTHTDAPIWANRKVSLRGKSSLGAISGTKYHFKVKLGQLLSMLTGRCF